MKITITPFKLSINTDAIFSREANIRLGREVFVASYRSRMRQGQGVDTDGPLPDEGNVASQKPLKIRQGGKNQPAGSIPLYRTGRMANSFRVNAALTTNRELVLDFPENEKAKAAAHQFGNKNVPARPHVGITREDMQRAVRFLEEHLQRNLDGIIDIS